MAVGPVGKIWNGLANWPVAARLRATATISYPLPKWPFSWWEAAMTAPAAKSSQKVWRGERHHELRRAGGMPVDRKSTRLNSSHLGISYAVFFLKKIYDTLILSTPTAFCVSTVLDQVPPATT